MNLFIVSPCLQNLREELNDITYAILVYARHLEANEDEYF